MRNLLGWLGTRLAQITIKYLKLPLITPCTPLPFPPDPPLQAPTHTQPRTCACSQPLHISGAAEVGADSLHEDRPSLSFDRHGAVSEHCGQLLAAAAPLEADLFCPLVDLRKQQQMTAAPLV